MRQVYLAGGLLLGALYVAVLAASASAFTLPDVSLTLSGTYPVTAVGSSSGATTLGSASGVTLEGTGATLLLSLTKLTALGEFTVTLTKVGFGAKKCNTSGEPAGTVVVSASGAVVPLNTTGAVGALALVPTTAVTCEGGNEVDVKGSVITSVNAGTENQELTTFGGALKGSKGKQSISEYINDTGSKVKAKFEQETNKDGEFTSGSLNITEEVVLQVAGSKMGVLTGR